MSWAESKLPACLSSPNKEPAYELREQILENLDGTCYTTPVCNLLLYSLGSPEGLSRSISNMADVLPCFLPVSICVLSVSPSLLFQNT